MDALHVARLRARYRLPAGDADARPRLDALLREVLDDALEHALDRAGVPRHEEVCVRRVDAPARLRLGAPDSALVAAWSVALADAIRAALDGGGPDVVRFRTRGHALADLLVSVARGDHARAWAWRQLGLWSAGDDASGEAAVEEAVRALLGHPESVVAALLAAARAGALPALAARIRPAAWTAVARAALEAAAVPDSAVRTLTHPSDPSAVRATGRPSGSGPSAGSPAGTAGDAEEVSASPSASSADAMLRRVRRIAGQSAIARAVLDRPEIAADRRRPLALLALLEAEPAALARGLAASVELVAAVEQEIAADGVDGLAAASRPDADGRTDADRRDAGRRTDASASADRDAERSRVESKASDDLTEAGAEPEADPMLAMRTAGETRWGGLLFLLHVVGELGIPEEVATSDVLAARSLRWVLLHVARALLGLDERDPAALAFAGLGPDRDPPTRGEEPATDAEMDGVDTLARRLEARLFERLRGEPAPDRRAASALLRETARRTATVEADPGWIDARLSLDEVSIDVRRAGLDLDPGWLAWLGVVVRFVYE
ncbi:MAG: hypothetical protein AB1941_13940 [Gemmatimonadota bacterium]